MDAENTVKECEGDKKDGRQCNPSFPHDVEVDETRIRGDAIGNTLYSERWVIKILMKLVKHCDEEWTDDFETELCLLWDMTMERDVVNLLMEHKFLELSSQIIKTTTLPRLTEMMVGIVGNLSCVQEVRAEISRDSGMIAMLLDLLSMPDAPMLVQLTRLIQTCTWDLRKPPETGESCWLKHLCDDNKWITSLTFILTSSTNKELLTSSLALLETLCYVPCSHQLVATHIASPDVVNGVVEASKQLHQGFGKDDCDLEKAASHSIEILSCFTSFSAGRQALGKQAETMSEALHTHLMTMHVDFMTEQRVAFISAAVTVMGTVLDVCGFFDPRIFNCFLSYLVHFQDVVNPEDEDDKHADVLDNLAEYFKLVVQLADKHLLATVLQDCSAAKVQVLQDIMTDSSNKTDT